MNTLFAKNFTDLSSQNVHKGIPFGNTGTVAGVFQVLAGLQKLRAWTLDTLWPWYKKHLPGLVDPGNDEIPAVGS